jgi:hypothetical protein
MYNEDGNDVYYNDMKKLLWRFVLLVLRFNDFNVTSAHAFITRLEEQMMNMAFGNMVIITHVDGLDPFIIEDILQTASLGRIDLQDAFNDGSGVSRQKLEQSLSSLATCKGLERYIMRRTRYAPWETTNHHADKDNTT